VRVRRHDHPTLTVALVGDSVAGNWFPAIDALALRYHWRLVTDLAPLLFSSSAVLAGHR
jgi:hypothetical protein